MQSASFLINTTFIPLSLSPTELWMIPICFFFFYFFFNKIIIQKSRENLLLHSFIYFFTKKNNFPLDAFIHKVISFFNFYLPHSLLVFSFHINNFKQFHFNSFIYYVFCFEIMTLTTVFSSLFYLYKLDTKYKIRNTK